MHISDGLLPPAVCAAGYVMAGGATWWSLRRVTERDVPRLALLTSAFFVASSIHVNLGGASVHLLLHGLIGVLAGPAAVIPILLGLVLQALLLGHGGVSTLGVNLVIMATPAVLFGVVARRMCRPSEGASLRPARAGLCGFLAGAGSVAGSLLLFLAVGLTAEPVFFSAIQVFAWAHLPLAVIEGAVAASAMSFLAQVRPDLLYGQMLSMADRRVSVP